MSSNLNTFSENNTLSAVYLNDNIACQQANIQAQQGVGVISGMGLSSGGGAVINVASGWVQNPRTVYFGGGSFNLTLTNGTWYIMVNWTNAYTPPADFSVYTFSFSQQLSPTPPSGQVCLGQVVIAGGAVVSVSTVGLVVLPHVAGSQFIVGQSRMVADDSTGMITVENLQGNVAVKNVLQSGDAAVIDAGYQILLFGSFTVPPGATFTNNGQLRIIT